MTNGKEISPEQARLHDEAVSKREFWYTDPDSGYRVLTAYFLVKRGYCCKSGCRHCPYGFEFEKEPNSHE